MFLWKWFFGRSGRDSPQEVSSGTGDSQSTTTGVEKNQKFGKKEAAELAQHMLDFHNKVDKCFKEGLQKDNDNIKELCTDKTTLENSRFKCIKRFEDILGNLEKSCDELKKMVSEEQEKIEKMYQDDTEETAQSELPKTLEKEIHEDKRQLTNDEVGSNQSTMTNEGKHKQPTETQPQDLRIDTANENSEMKSLESNIDQSQSSSAGPPVQSQLKSLESCIPETSERISSESYTSLNDQMKSLESNIENVKHQSRSSPAESSATALQAEGQLKSLESDIERTPQRASSRSPKDLRKQNDQPMSLESTIQYNNEKLKSFPAAASQVETQPKSLESDIEKKPKRILGGHFAPYNSDPDDQPMSLGTHIANYKT